MDEIWKPVVGYEADFLVSNHGGVKRLRRELHQKWSRTKSGWRTVVYKERVLSPWKMGNKSTKHYYVALSPPGKRKTEGRTVAVHRLVLEAFVGPCPEGMECCHCDGDSFNNRVDNLRWDTPKANMADRERHGRHVKGSMSCKAVLTESDIPIIRQLVAEGRSYSSIGRQYKIAAIAISCIARGVTWKHVP